MRKSVGLAIIALLLATTAVCQDYPKAEVFGGYQFTRINPGGGDNGENFNGWNAAVTGNVNRCLGVTADFSGAYKSIGGVSVKQYTFLFGPTLASHSSDKFTPFVHALFGGAHLSASGEGESASDTVFAMALGGGVDIAATKAVAVRIGQFDYLRTRFSGTSQNDFRYSAGIVFRFGK